MASESHVVWVGDARSKRKHGQVHRKSLRDADRWRIPSTNLVKTKNEASILSRQMVLLALQKSVLRCGFVK